MPKCPGCGLTGVAAFSVGDLNRRITEWTFNYHRCPGCGLLFLSPVPQDLGRYYSDAYYARGLTATQLADSLGPELYKIETVQRFAAAGRLLEIGPGNGGFALLAKRAGFDVSVIEMDAQSCEFLAEKVGVRTVESADTVAVLREERRRHAPPYDVVAAWHVVEHVANPRQVMRAAADRLNPGGILVLAMPNPGSLQFRMLRGAWAHVDAPRHLTLISLPLLCQWAGESGLSAELITTADRGSIDWNAFGWERSVRNLLLIAGVPDGGAVYRLSRAAGHALDRIARPMERAGMLGTTYTVVFRKREAAAAALNRENIASMSGPTEGLATL
jgi:2-polyprenyl-3-methyl-5-hydroxy-6-metoxy-1,4-benzoquinol methylase